MKLTLSLLALFVLPALLAAEPRIVAQPSQSALISFRLVFLTGAASDPAGKEGTAALTASMLAGGGTRERTYKQIVDAFFPMAVSVTEMVDKEMISFSADTHIDNLEKFYSIFRSMILEPGWRDEDLQRQRDLLVNTLRVSIRGNNDEELGKEVLYSELYRGHPYAHHNLGKVSSLQKLTIEDLQAFHRSQFTQANLIIGISGGYPQGFPARLQRDFAKLPRGTAARVNLPAPPAIPANQIILVEKDTRSVAYSLGFPIEVTRSHPDYVALLLAQTYFGQHRSSAGRLYNRMRAARGLNYGDYAYIEYFPRGMFQFTPDPNLARRQQIFQVWIRPVEPPTAHFALRLALFELERFVSQGISAADFEETRSFLTKNVNLLTKTASDNLGYAIDSSVYGIGDYNQFVKQSLAKLTLDKVNAAIRKHLRSDRMVIVAILKGAEEFKQALLTGAPSPMIYNSPKPEDILAEDKIVEKLPIRIDKEAIRVVPVSGIFE